jgi:hypothetical protein
VPCIFLRWDCVSTVQVGNCSHFHVNVFNNQIVWLIFAPFHGLEVWIHVLRLQVEKLNAKFIFQSPTDKQRAFMVTLNFRFDRMSTATTMGQTTKTGETLFFIFWYSTERFHLIAVSTWQYETRIPSCIVKVGNFDLLKLNKCFLEIAKDSIPDS